MSYPQPRPLVRSAPRHDTAGVVLGLATATMGLVAGVYLVLACGVMPGLHRVGDRAFIDTMQRINETIENPVFFAGLFGALAFPGVAIVQQRRRGRRAVMLWTVAALTLYGIGFLVTVGANVPLNNELAAAGDPTRIVDPATVRERFEVSWNVWNIVRAVVSTAALGCLGRALVLHGRTRAAR